MDDKMMVQMIEHDLNKLTEKVGGIQFIHSTTPDQLPENRRWHLRVGGHRRVLTDEQVVGFIDGFSDALAVISDRDEGRAITGVAADYRRAEVTFAFEMPDEEHEGEDDASVAELALDLVFEMLTSEKIDPENCVTVTRPIVTARKDESEEASVLSLQKVEYEERFPLPIDCPDCGMTIESRQELHDHDCPEA